MSGTISTLAATAVSLPSLSVFHVISRTHT